MPHHDLKWEILAANVTLYEEVDMSRERSEEVMRRYLTGAVMEGKWEEVIPEIAAEDMWDHTQPEPGREGLKNHVSGFLALMPDVQIVINHIIADEDKVVGVWTFRATPSAEFMDFPLGTPVEGHVATIFQLRDGMIIDYQVIAAGRTTTEPVQMSGISNIVQE